MIARYPREPGGGRIFVSGARGLFRLKCLCFPRTGRVPPPPREARHLHRRGRGYLYVGWVTRKVDVKVKGIQSIPQDVHVPGRSGPTWWSLQNRGSPRPRRRAKRGGRSAASGGAPKGGQGTRSGGVGATNPIKVNLIGARKHSPSTSSRSARRMPAPRAGERTLSAFFHWLRPLRPAPGTVRSRPARGRFSVLPRYNHRAPRLRKLSFPDPRGRYPIVFQKTIPARYSK